MLLLVDDAIAEVERDGPVIAPIVNRRAAMTGDASAEWNRKAVDAGDFKSRR